MVPDMQPANALARMRKMLEETRRLVDEARSTVRSLGSTTIDKGDLILKGGGTVKLLDGLDRVVVKLFDGALHMNEPDTGEAMQLTYGQIFLWDDYKNNPGGYGSISTDKISGANYMRFIPPSTTGDGFQNSFTMRGSAPGSPGAGWWYSDGPARVEAQNLFLNGGPNVVMDATNIFIDATGVLNLEGKEVSVNPTDGVLTIYNLKTTGGGYLLRYNVIGGKWTMALDSSSARYKTDFTDVDEDFADAVLQWETQWFKYISEVEADGGAAPWHMGFVAEQVDEHTPVFVVRNEAGQVDALQYERMVAGQQVVIQRQEKLIADLTARADAQDERLDALETP